MENHSEYVVKSYVDEHRRNQVKSNFNSEVAFCVNQCVKAFDDKRMLKEEDACLESCFYKLLENKNINLMN